MTDKIKTQSAPGSGAPASTKNGNNEHRDYTTRRVRAQVGEE